MSKWIFFLKQKKMRKNKTDIDFLKDQNEWCMTMFREIKSPLVEHGEEVFFFPQKICFRLYQGEELRILSWELERKSKKMVEHHAIMEY